MNTAPTSSRSTEQNTDKHLVDAVNGLVGIAADHLRHLGAAVPEADHAGEIVMHGAADDVADGDGDESDGPEQDALDGSKDGAGARDIQQVDEAVLPAPHGDVVHAVLLGIGGGLPVVGAEDLFAELAVDGGSAEKDHEADDKGCHVHTLLFLSLRFSRGEKNRRTASSVITIADFAHGCR